jgi:membrane fusion protein (multidrug efflux system)
VNLVGENNVIESREVGLAFKYGNMWVVDEGLKKGDMVVLEGLQVAREGVKINPLPTEFEIIHENI